jgi:predicted nucleic acid-binding protein
MNYVPKLFIETTVFNFYFEGKQGQKQRDAIRLFDEIAKGKYEAHTSRGVINELIKAPGEKSIKMLSLINKYIKKVIESSTEANFLEQKYTAKGIIPEKYQADAFHIAIAAINNLDFVISYNLGHIVKTKTMIGTGLVNLREGYRQIGLSTPTEVLEYDR